jgi:hypothetical protein
LKLLSLETAVVLSSEYWLNVCMVKNSAPFFLKKSSALAGAEANAPVALDRILKQLEGYIPFCENF